jgi:hypothetical protein
MVIILHVPVPMSYDASYQLVSKVVTKLLQMVDILISYM